MNAGAFIVGKMIMKKTGANIMNMMNNMNGEQTAPTQPQKQKRKMKGPTINVDEIPDVS